NLKKDPSAIILPFGKHKGKTVAELLAVDPQYADWVSAQAWVAERFAELHSAIISRGAGVDDSPEHNAIQGRFLDPLFRTGFLRVVRGWEITSHGATLVTWIKDTREAPIRKLSEKIKEQETRVGWKKEELAKYKFPPYPPGSHAVNLQTHVKELTMSIDESKTEIDRIRKEIDVLDDPGNFPPVIGSDVTFETRGLDVLIKGWVRLTTSHGEKEGRALRDVKTEIKPTIGDDYPTVIRQMRRLEADVLVAGMYTGRGVSEPQMREMFRMSGITVVFVQEIEEEMRKATTPEWW